MGLDYPYILSKDMSDNPVVHRLDASGRVVRDSQFSQNQTLWAQFSLTNNVMIDFMHMESYGIINDSWTIRVQ